MPNDKLTIIDRAYTWLKRGNINPNLGKPDRYGARFNGFSGGWGSGGEYGQFGSTGYAQFGPGGNLLRYFPNTTRNFYREAGDFTFSSVVMGGVGWIARNFPEAPIRIIQRDKTGKKEFLPSHPMSDLFETPNPYYTGELLSMAIQASLNIDGNAYLYKGRDSRGIVRELWYLPHFLIEPRWPVNSNDVYVEYYEYRANGLRFRYEVDEIVHIRYGIDPNNTRKGIAPLRSALREIVTDNDAAVFAAALMKNMGMAGMIITPSAKDPTAGFSLDDQRTIKEDIQRKTTGDAAGSTMFLDGPVELQHMGFNPEELDIKAARRIPEERVCSLLGIHPLVIGFGAGLDHSTMANYEQARRASYEDCIKPLQRIIGPQIQNQLLVDFINDSEKRKLSVGFDLSEVAVLQQDQNSKHDRVRKDYVSGFITRAEARAETGRFVRPDDEDVYYTKPAQGGTSINPLQQDPPQDDPENAKQYTNGHAKE